MDTATGAATIAARHLSICAGLLLAVVPIDAAFGQRADFAQCKGLVFSTEEDFLSRGKEPPDGNPLVSDGDLLAYDAASANTIVCARNRDLVQRFDVSEDVGLDAVDVIDAEAGIIAFSTELDSPHGNFGQGDVLFPDGTVIPNAVFAMPFKLRDNIGLDGVHFTGDRDRIFEAVKVAREIGRDGLRNDPGGYIGKLKEIGVDIWFTVEGTGPDPKNPSVLDGDILSLVTGSKVAPQSVLLDPPVPAGIPSRGVDFGADALSADRKGNRKTILFSTEILYRGDRVTFTDGDVLRIGGGMAIKHPVLIKALEPAADFLGLDALSFARQKFAQVPRLDNLCGNAFIPRSPRDFDGAGLWRANFDTSPPGDEPRRPCGRYVPIDGELTPAMDVKRFRIAYRLAGDPLPPVGTAPGIHTKWNIKTRDALTLLCSPAAVNLISLASDGTVQQWMDGSNYLDARNGTGTFSDGCPNSGLQLAVWNTLSLPAGDQNSHFIVWLEWETNGGVVMRDPFDYHVQLDNKVPTGTPGANDAIKLEVRLADGSGKPVPACGEAPTGDSKFEVWAQFDDPHYWFFTVTVEGGAPPVSHTFERIPGDKTHEYFEMPDGPPGLKNTDATGTTPDGLLVHIRDIDLTELGQSFQKCCYLLELWVYDAAIRHNFNGFAASQIIEHRRRVFTTFAAG